MSPIFCASCGKQITEKHFVYLGDSPVHFRELCIEYIIKHSETGYTEKDLDQILENYENE